VGLTYKRGGGVSVVAPLLSICFIPYFNMHYLTFVIIGTNTNIEAQVAEALDPFWEELEVEPYRHYLDQDEIAHMASRSETEDPHELADRMEQWYGRPGGVDTRGVYYTTTMNPDGYWDWYEVGGRWDRHIPHVHLCCLTKSAEYYHILRRSNHLPRRSLRSLCPRLLRALIHELLQFCRLP
jgi:hypothetical protein